MRKLFYSKLNKHLFLLLISTSLIPMTTQSKKVKQWLACSLDNWTFAHVLFKQHQLDLDIVGAPFRFPCNFFSSKKKIIQGIHKSDDKKFKTIHLERWIGSKSFYRWIEYDFKIFSFGCTILRSSSFSSFRKHPPRP